MLTVESGGLNRAQGGEFFGALRNQRVPQIPKPHTLNRGTLKPRLPRRVVGATPDLNSSPPWRLRSESTAPSTGFGFGFTEGLGYLGLGFTVGFWVS